MTGAPTRPAVDSDVCSLLGSRAVTLVCVVLSPHENSVVASTGRLTRVSTYTRRVQQRDLRIADSRSQPRASRAAAQTVSPSPRGRGAWGEGPGTHQPQRLREEVAPHDCEAGGAVRQRHRQPGVMHEETKTGDARSEASSARECPGTTAARPNHPLHPPSPEGRLPIAQDEILGPRPRRKT